MAPFRPSLRLKATQYHQPVLGPRTWPVNYPYQVWCSQMQALIYVKRSVLELALQVRPSSLSLVSTIVLWNISIILLLLRDCVSQKLIKYKLLYTQCSIGGHTLTITPTNLVVTEFSSVSFNCTSSGLTLPTISWYSNTNGAQMKLSASSSNIMIQQVSVGDQLTSTLTLLSAARSDAGQYICSVTSQLGNATTAATLTVLCKWLLCSMQSYVILWCLHVLQLLPHSMNSHKARSLFSHLLPPSLAQLMVCLDQSSRGWRSSMDLQFPSHNPLNTPL